MQAFILNSHGRMVFPSNIMPELDFSALDTLDQLDRVIRRDFETKAPTGTDILRRVEQGGYANRYELMRDLALNLFWANRFAVTMYDKRPTRWADVPRTRSDVFLPVLTPWEDGDTKVAAVRDAYAALPAAWDAAVEDPIFEVLFDVFGHRKHHATTLPAVKATVAQCLAEPSGLTFRLPSYDPDYPVYDFNDIVDCSEDVPELEALHRWAMVLHNQYPWDRAQVELAPVGELQPEDYVVAFHPKDKEVRAFLRRLADGTAASRPVAPAWESKAPVRPYRAIDVRASFRVLPRLEALAVVHGDQVCGNEDLIRNAAYNWSPMGADEIRDKTGIEQRRYSSLTPGGARAAGGPGRPGQGAARPGGDRRRAGVHLHQLAAHPVGRDLPLGPARDGTDPRLLRPHRGLRRHAVRPGGGDPAAPGGGAAGARGLRREVLRQDRQRAPLADDLR